jgi:hypothetical protein
MPQTILSVNAGSSSVKITIFREEQEKDKPPIKLATVQIAGLTAPPATFTYTRGSEQNTEDIDKEINNPHDAFKYLLQRCFNEPKLQEVASKHDFAYVCHRVVHGGDYDRGVVITKETYHHLEALEDLAPLYGNISRSNVSPYLKKHALTGSTGTMPPHWGSYAPLCMSSPTQKTSHISIPPTTSRCLTTSRRTRLTKRKQSPMDCGNTASMGSATRLLFALCPISSSNLWQRPT